MSPTPQTTLATFAFALATLLLGSAPAEAAYQCKTAEGKVVYQQTPCSAGFQGTRLNTRNPTETRAPATQPAVTWGEVRRAKSQCDEIARRKYADDDARRNRERLSCMDRVERACGSNRESTRCRREMRNTRSRVERVRTPKPTKRSRTPGDPELMNAKATCHAWSSSDPSYRTRRTRGQACQALADACAADRQGPECRERIRQLRPR